MHQVCQMQILQTWCTLDLACDWLLGAVGGPAHGPQADVVEPAAGALLPVLVAFSQRKELSLAASQRSRNGAVVPAGMRGSRSAWKQPARSRPFDATWVLQKPKLGNEITMCILGV